MAVEPWRMDDLARPSGAAAGGPQNAERRARPQAQRAGLVLCRYVLACALTVACQPTPPHDKGAAAEPDAGPRWTALQLPATASATAADPEGLEPDLEQALAMLRARTRCNDVSGCPAEARILAAGAAASLPLRRLAHAAHARAPWLPRVALLLGAVGDSEALDTLRMLARREEDAVRAAAHFALLRRDAADLDQLRADAAMLSPAAVSRTRLVVLWGLAGRGDAGAAVGFDALMRELAQQLVAADSLRFGAWLCGEAAVPRCDGLYEPLARHPALLVRREVLRRVEGAPMAAHLPALRLLAADPTATLARRAQEVLARVPAPAAMASPAGGAPSVGSVTPGPDGN